MKRKKLFISYSHKDRIWLDRLQIHLKPLERAGIIDRWDDTRIQIGARWKEDIKEALASCKVAVLLVSADFLASDFIHEDELPSLLSASETEGLVVMPVIIKPCRFKQTKTLSQFQSVNPPEKAVLGMSEIEQEEVWVKLTDAIEGALKESSVHEASPQEAPQASHPKRLLEVDWASTPRKNLKLETLIRLAEAIGGRADIGQLVGTALKTVGSLGVVVVEDSNRADSSVEFMQGMRLDRGYIHPYFVTDLDRMTAELKEPSILIYGRKISNAQVLPLLENSINPLLIIAEDVDEEALATLIGTKLRGMISVVAVEAMGVGERRLAIMHDTAILTGRSVVSRTLEETDPKSLGTAGRVVVTKDETLVIDAKGDPAEVLGRIAQIEREMDETTNDYERETLRDRLGRISGGVAVIRVGASTIAEIGRSTGLIQRTVSALCSWVELGLIPRPPMS